MVCSAFVAVLYTIVNARKRRIRVTDGKIFVLCQVCYRVILMRMKLTSLFVAGSVLALCQCQPVPLPQMPGQSAPVVYMPEEMCYLDEVAPLVKVDLKYCGNDNFVGRPIAGYTTGHRAVLRKDTALALKQASESLAKEGLGILVWDAYRPSRAMKDFYAWSQTGDDKTKAEFYPNISKREIYEHRYIGKVSEHSWGVAVDITLIDLKTGKELDMGGRHDLLDASSATNSPLITAAQRANRRKLCDTMAAVGMRNYSKEWWHYFLAEKGTCYQYDFPLNDNMQPRQSQNP